MLAGKESTAFDVRALIKELALTDNVRITGYLPYQEYFEYIALSDACVSLRYPTVRATSANILKIMAQGKPVLVSDLGELFDLPASVCLKIPLDDSEVSSLLNNFQRLYRDTEYRQTLGREARVYVEINHSITKAAEHYSTFCHTMI